MPKIRVFRNQSSSNPTAVMIGIPDEIQLDTDINSIQLSQVEILPPPSSVSDLFIEPLVINNSACTANANVSATVLQPGFKLSAVPITNNVGVIDALEVEEVMIPEGYIHLDDFSSWHSQNYNAQNKITPDNFKRLPGAQNNPQGLVFDVDIQDKKFTCTHSADITEIKIYYKREKQRSWVEWASINKSEDVIFPHTGKFDFRFVPFYEGKQIGTIKHKEAFRKWKKTTKLHWSDIQLRKDLYQVVMSGDVGTDVNYVKVYQKLTNGQKKYKEITSFEINPDTTGKVDIIFTVENISAVEKYPCLEYRFYRKNMEKFPALIYVKTESYNLTSNYNNIPGISCIVEKVEKSKFLIRIQDSNKRLFRPPQPQRWREQTDWEQVAIPNKQIMLRLSINRYQNGNRRNYGTYLVNYTQGEDPKFLDGLPFKIKSLSDNTIGFVFEDSEDFRALQSIDSPDQYTQNLTYEFRLLGWTAGIEESLLTNVPKIIPKREQVIFDGKLRVRDFAYNTWALEHPQAIHSQIMPLAPSEDTNQNHLKYGSFYEGFVVQSEPTDFTPSRNIITRGVGWKVLYYYSSENDEIQEFPYYCFNVEIPYSSRQIIDTIDVCISSKNNDAPMLIGTYHPSQFFQVVDFAGYFKAREYVTQQSNLSGIISNTPTLGASLLQDTVATGNSSAFASGLVAHGLDTPSATVTTTTDWNPQIGTPFVGTTSISSSQLGSSTVASVNTMVVNTFADNLEAINSMRVVNNSIAETAEVGTIEYIIKVKYTDGDVREFPYSAAISDRPRLPPDPPGNTSIVVGNQTISAAVYSVSQESSQQLVQAISSTAQSTNNLQNVVSTTFAASSISFGDY